MFFKTLDLDPDPHWNQFRILNTTNLHPPVSISKVLKPSCYYYYRWNVLRYYLVSIHTSVSDPDPHWFFGGWIRTRPGNADPDPGGGKNDPQTHRNTDPPPTCLHIEGPEALLSRPEPAAGGRLTLGHPDHLLLPHLTHPLVHETLELRLVAVHVLPVQLRHQVLFRALLPRRDALQLFGCTLWPLDVGAGLEAGLVKNPFFYK